MHWKSGSKWWPAWPDLSHFGEILIDLANYLRSYLVLSNILNLLWQSFIVVNDPICKQNLAIWSHWIGDHRSNCGHRHHQHCRRDHHPHCRPLAPLFTSNKNRQFTAPMRSPFHGPINEEFGLPQPLLDLASCLMQCDQMAISFFQYLAIYINENLPYSIRNLPKLA